MPATALRPHRYLLLAGTLLLFLGITGIFSCQEKRPFLDDPDGKQEVEETITAPNPILELIPAERSGLTFKNIIRETDDDNLYTNNIKYNGGGLAVADFDNDGLQDLYFICTNGKNALYRNTGKLTFQDITDQAGVGSEDGFETAATAVDINNDGWMDLYVCRAGVLTGDIRRNRLFVNNGPVAGGSQWSGKFTEQAALYGLDDPAGSTGANFFDFDNDGDLDLYLLNHPVTGEYSNKFEATPAPDGKSYIPIKAPKDWIDSDHLYRNDGPPGAGKGGFTDISREAGIWNSAYGLSVSVSDLNRDGRPDVYVANDFIRPDFYYINNGNGTFTESLEQAFRHTSRHTMGSDLTDFDNDGLVDLYTVDMLPMSNYRLKTTKVTMTQSLYSTTIQSGYYEPVVRNVLQRNNGNGTFSDIGCLSGVYKTEWSWSGLVFDIDNDGWRDIYVTNGYRRNVNDNDFFEYTFQDISKIVDPFHLKSYFKNIHEFLRLIPTYKPRNCCFQNKGDWSFADKQGDWLTLPASWSNGAAWSDLDNDGDLDLITNNLEDPPLLYGNRTADQKKGHYLQLRLAGSPGNPNAVGASALIEYGGNRQYLEQNPVRGIFSSVEQLLHFGLGNATQVDKLTLRWPDGKTQTLLNLPVDQRLELRYENAAGYVAHLVPIRPQESYFQNVTKSQTLAYRHTENPFNDFEAWPLNLSRQSDHGPLVAAGDVNGDGLDDFFIGNSFDQPAALYLQTPGGGFRQSSAPTWQQDRIYEDHDAVFFDADQDGDQDLYVVSGGMESPNEQAWQDRLYTNDGRGNFSRAADALPVINTVGQRVLAADLDSDGDLDLAVGGRNVGRKWPLTPRSLILRNDGKGRFEDATAQLAPAFEYCGMVTDLCLANLDNTPAPELIVCGEWMPLSIFRYNGSQWVNATDAFGLSLTHGLWNSLQCADLDGDGDLDLIGGNLGLNTRLSASAEAPMRVFAGDFDQNGILDPIVTFSENGKDYPLVQKMVMSQHIPKIKKEYLLSNNYCWAAIHDIFPKKDVDQALRLTAYTLETGWWRNDNGKFIRQTLPLPAQIAPANALLCADFTGDGITDILIAGNKYGLEVETNRLDAGNGVLLQGDGKGHFRFVDNLQSGFWASGEARDMALLRGPAGKRWVVVANNNAPVQVFQAKVSAPVQ